MINRQTARMILKLFDCCFKRGVIDASEVDNEHWCHEFIEARHTQRDFSLLDVTDIYDWKEWRMILARWCRYSRNMKLCPEYLDRVYKENYYWSIFPIAMDFYILGIQEWLEYPNPYKLELFKFTPSVHWKPMPRKNLEKLTIDDKVSYIQQFAFDRERLDPEGNGKYTNFAQDMWAYTRPLPPDPLKSMKDVKDF